MAVPLLRVRLSKANQSTVRRVRRFRSLGGFISSNWSLKSWFLLPLAKEDVDPVLPLRALPGIGGLGTIANSSRFEFSTVEFSLVEHQCGCLYR